MKYIHQETHWPDLYWDNQALAAPLAAIRNKQGFLLGRMSTFGFDIRSEASLETLTTNIIKSSEIEGEHLNKEQVRSSAAKHLGLDIAGLKSATRHVDGIVEMMLDATQHYQKPLTEERLFNWHSALFPTLRSGLKIITVGMWRPPESDPMQIVSGPMGREKVHFEAPSASSLPEEMHTFLDWFNHAENLDPVIKAGVAHFWFVTIHPFEDGNGRIGRAIMDMCLALADNIPERFYSMSAQIEHERKAYYQMLEQTSKGNLDITPWLNWFLSCLDHAIDNAHLILDKVLYKAGVWKKLSTHTVNDRQTKVINRLFENFKGKLTTSKYAKLAKCSHDTALRDIQKLIDFGVMEKDESGGRSTSYRLVRN